MTVTTPSRLHQELVARPRGSAEPVGQVGAEGHAGTTPRTCRARQLEQPLHPVTVPRIWFEQLGQSIVIDLRAGQSPPDVPGHVIVAEAHRVGITERSVPHLGRGPGPDPRYGAQAPMCVIEGQVDTLLEPASSPGGPNGCRRPRTVDPGPQRLRRSAKERSELGISGVELAKR